MQKFSNDIGFYEYKKEERKTFSARVFPNGNIMVKAPLIASDDETNAFILRKKIWIIKQINYFKAFNYTIIQSYENGSSLLYLGRQYQLVVKKAPLKNIVKIEQNKIILYSSTPEKKEEIKKAIELWFLKRAESIFMERLKIVMCSFFDFQIPTLKIRKLDKRWGSYLKKHEIILNPLLIKAPKSAIDYVVAHELCHFYYKSHNKDFYDLLSSKIPNWKEVKQKLEKRLLGI